MPYTSEASILSRQSPSAYKMRSEVVNVARSWVGTKYLSNAMVKGVGTDCAMLLLAVYREAGIVPEDFSPEAYSPQWHLHRGEEKYLEVVLKFAKEFDGPPLVGDVVMFKVGRLFAHAGIVVEWPTIIHARGDSKVVLEEDISRNGFGKHAIWRQERRFFSPWTS